jgi:hypothetical protein
MAIVDPVFAAADDTIHDSDGFAAVMQFHDVGVQSYT